MALHILDRLANSDATLASKKFPLFDSIWLQSSVIISPKNDCFEILVHRPYHELVDVDTRLQRLGSSPAPVFWAHCLFDRHLQSLLVTTLTTYGRIHEELRNQSKFKSSHLVDTNDSSVSPQDRRQYLSSILQKVLTIWQKALTITPFQGPLLPNKKLNVWFNSILTNANVATSETYSPVHKFLEGLFQLHGYVANLRYAIQALVIGLYRLGFIEDRHVYTSIQRLSEALSAALRDLSASIQSDRNALTPLLEASTDTLSAVSGLTSCAAALYSMGSHFAQKWQQFEKTLPNSWSSKSPTKFKNLDKNEINVAQIHDALWDLHFHILPPFIGLCHDSLVDPMRKLGNSTDMILLGRLALQCNLSFANELWLRLLEDPPHHVWSSHLTIGDAFYAWTIHYIHHLLSYGLSSVENRLARYNRLLQDAKKCPELLNLCRKESSAFGAEIRAILVVWDLRPPDTESLPVHHRFIQEALMSKANEGHAFFKFCLDQYLTKHQAIEAILNHSVFDSPELSLYEIPTPLSVSGKAHQQLVLSALDLVAIVNPRDVSAADGLPQTNSNQWLRVDSSDSLSDPNNVNAPNSRSLPPKRGLPQSAWGHKPTESPKLGPASQFGLKSSKEDHHAVKQMSKSRFSRRKSNPGPGASAEPSRGRHQHRYHRPQSKQSHSKQVPRDFY